MKMKNSASDLRKLQPFNVGNEAKQYWRKALQRENMKAKMTVTSTIRKKKCRKKKIEGRNTNDINEEENEEASPIQSLGNLEG